MRLLSRYLLRQLAAPFLFALAALTSLMLLSQIAKKFGALVGKGLPWGVIGEVFALSLPFIVAMTLPMAVLLAVLYAFSHLAADNEITAMRASGISVYQILAPVLAWGVFMSAFNFAFVDQVLPRTNARLRGLLIDIGRKKPTLELREQVINEVPPSQYFLRAGRIDARHRAPQGHHHLRRGRGEQPPGHLCRQRPDGLRRGPDRPQPPAVRRRDPPVPPERPADASSSPTTASTTSGSRTCTTSWCGTAPRRCGATAR